MELNIQNPVAVVNNKNMPGSVEVQPGTKAEGVLMSSDVNAPFVFNIAGGDSHPEPLCPCDDVCASQSAFVVNLLPVSGRGGVVVAVGYLDYTPNLVRCLI